MPQKFKIGDRVQIVESVKDFGGEKGKVSILCPRSMSKTYGYGVVLDSNELNWVGFEENELKACN